MGILPKRSPPGLNKTNMPTRPTTRHLLLLAVVLAGGVVAIVATRSKPTAAQMPAVARPAAPTGPLNPAAQALIDHANGGRCHEASVAAESLPADLALDDFRRLLAFSLGHQPKNLTSQAWDVVVNDIWEALRRQHSYPPEFASELVAYFRAPSTTDVLKDYAIQHLGGWLSSDLPAGAGENDLAVRQQVLSFLVEASGMRTKTYSGTALYALDRSIRPGGAAEEACPALGPIKAACIAPLQDAALALVNDASASTHARISAFQIALERRDLRALASARKIAADPAVPPMLRASAIACLGRIGAPSDLEILAPIARNCTDPRLLCALKPAMESLSKPQAPAGS